MFSVGEALRRARLEQGLDVPTVAARTKISARYLEAIESDDRKALPSAFFYKSFVDQYARALSLDTREIAAEVDRILSADAPLPLPGQELDYVRSLPPVTVTPRFPQRSLYTMLAAFAALTLVIGGCSAVYIWWHGRRTTVIAKAESAGVKAQPVKAAPAPAASTAPPPPASVTHQREAAPANTVPVALAKAAADSPPVVAPVANGSKVLLDLVAREATWLSVSSDGKPVFSGLLRPNESKIVEGEKIAKMRVGNAGGLEVHLNGRLLPTLGERGQVLIVVFTPDNFQIFAPPKESGD
ncbi:MAG TPA: RodZ domain-containing protein [Bryobacteraceae bacterium]|nr:RodZ domain-containing protein [Bryobacteraceae bacterium]